MTLNATTGLNGTVDFLAGGTITIDGTEIIVPRNLLATLPSITVAWSELFENGVPNLPGISDTTWEATVSSLNQIASNLIANSITGPRKSCSQSVHCRFSIPHSESHKIASRFYHRH